MKEPVTLHEDVARVLGTLGQAPTPEGMEARIVARLRQRQAEFVATPAQPRYLLRWRLVGAGVLAVAGVMLLGRHRASEVVPQVVEMRPQVMPTAPLVAVKVEHGRPRVVHVPVRSAATFAPSQVAPPLPLTQQEKTLLALARRPRVLAGLGPVATSETVDDHGLGENALFELDHEELAQLKTTLQAAPLKSSLLQTKYSGEIE